MKQVDGKTRMKGSLSENVSCMLLDELISFYFFENPSACISLKMKRVGRMRLSTPKSSTNKNQQPN